MCLKPGHSILLEKIKGDFMNQISDINGDKILIKGYVRADGTEVSSHWRRLPGKALLTIFNRDKSQDSNDFAGNANSNPYFQMDDKGFLEKLRETIENMPESEARNNLLNTITKLEGFGIMQDGQINNGAARLEELKQKVTEIINYLPEGKIKNALSVINAVAQDLLNWDGIRKQLPENPDEKAKETLKREMEFVVKNVGQMINKDFLEVDWGHLVQTLGIGEALNTVNPILNQVATIAADVTPKVINIVKAAKGKDKDLLKIMKNALGLLPAVGSVFGQIGSKVGEKILENPKLAELYSDLKGIDTVSKRFDAYIKNDMPEGSIKELNRLVDLSDGLQNKAYQLEGSVEDSNELKSFRQKLFQPTQMTTAAAPLTLNGGVDNYEQMLLDLVKLDNLPPPEFKYNEPEDIFYREHPNLAKLTVDAGMFIENLKSPENIEDAKSMWQIASSKFDNKVINNYMSQNGSVINSINEIKVPELKQVVQNKVFEQMGMKDSKGLIYHNDSNLSKEIANSKEFKNFIMDNKNYLKKGGVIKKDSLRLSSTKNLYLSLNNVDILGTHVDKNGDLVSICFDTYDFNKNDPEWKVRVAYAAQYGKVIENFYNLIIIKIPKNQWEKYN